MAHVVVAGANGAVGFELTRQLLEAGHEVTGITRSDSGARRLRDAGARGVAVDVLDRDALLSALDGVRADAVVHEATALTKLPTAHRHLDATDRLRTQGTENLVELAVRTGASRFVTQSFLFGYGYHDHGTTPVTEDAEFAPPAAGRFEDHVRAMRHNERLVLGDERFAGVALRYGIFYGDDPNTRRLLDMAAKGWLVAPRHGATVSFVHLQDAAAAAVAALRSGSDAQAYNVADDDPVSWTTFMRRVAHAAGGRDPFLVPNWALRASPYLGPLMTRANLALDNHKAKRELGWSPRYGSSREGLAAVARNRRDRAEG